MNRFLLCLYFFIAIFFSFFNAKAQNQTVNNGATTNDITFPGTGCTYTWLNNKPEIGLAASGNGNIPSFTALNNTNSPITATITAKPLASGGNAYIANYASNSVSVIGTKTKKVIATISVSTNPFGVSASDDGKLVYVTNRGSNTVSVISTKTNTVINTINVGRAPQGVVVSPDGARLYVANSIDNTVSVINTLTNVIVKTIDVGEAPYGITISADGANIYVANFDSNNVSIINTTTNTVTATVAVGVNPTGISVIPDGSRVYVSSSYNVTAINTIANNTTSTINLTKGIGMAPSPDGRIIYVATLNGYYSAIYVQYNNFSAQAGISGGTGISITPDGTDIYWVSRFNNTVSITNPIFSEAVIVPVGNNPYSIGNFISKGTDCDGSPITYTITVNPTPKINATAVTGNIVTCEGEASTSPDIGQLTISASNLSADIMATAPAGFEISLNATSGFSTNISLKAVAAAVDNTVLYVRLAASAPAGSLKGKIMLTSAGAQNNEVDVTGIVQQLPTVTAVNNQLLVSGNRTNNVVFSGTADVFSWSVTGDNIGLPLSGTGSFPSFLVSNNTSTAKVAVVTVTPLANATGGKGCDGLPVSFTITVNPLPNITASSQPLSMNTIYGTASAASSFKVSATNLIEGILITPPLGFELSTDNIVFTNIITIPYAKGPVTNFTVYLRLTSTSNAGNYSGNIILSSNGAANLNVPVSNSLVMPADITLTADNKNKIYGSTLNNISSGAGFTITAGGLKNGNSITSVNLTYGTGAAGTDPVGFYSTISAMVNTGANGFLISNYNISYVRGNINVLPAPLVITADNKTKVVNSDNPFLTVTYLGFVNNESANQLTTKPAVTTDATKTSAVGQYTITAGGAASANYTISYLPGVLTITPAPLALKVPNVFTPNGDGINDYWNIAGLDFSKNIVVSVFNRWGSRVFYSNGYLELWDGTYKGNPLPAGTYYYIINIGNNVDVLSGSITIMR